MGNVLAQLGAFGCGGKYSMTKNIKVKRGLLVKKKTADKIYKKRTLKYNYKSIKHYKIKTKMETPVSEINKALILYVLKTATEKYGYKELDKLRIVKILYLIDRAVKHKSNKQISNYSYTLERLGPLDFKILDDLDTLRQENQIINSINLYNFTISEPSSQLLKYAQEQSSRINECLQEDEITEIFDTAKNLNFLLNYVHNLDEVKHTRYREQIVI